MLAAAAVETEFVEEEGVEAMLALVLVASAVAFEGVAVACSSRRQS